MGKSTSGPDMLDVRNAIGAIEEANGVRIAIKLEMQRKSALDALTVTVEAKSLIALLNGPSQVTHTSTWPNGHGYDLAAHLLSALYALDVLCLKTFWHQTEIPTS